MSRTAKRPGTGAKRARRDVPCAHEIVYSSVSPHATALSFYKPPSADALFSATRRTGEDNGENASSSVPPARSSFPQVNLLPQDDLDLDPRDPGDTLLSFLSNRGRRIVTPSRNSLYIFDVPGIAPDIAETVSHWADPIVPEGFNNAPLQASGGVGRVRIEDIASYMEAFYAGMQIKIVRNHFCIDTWRQGRGGIISVVERGHVALTAPDGSSTRIRFRPSKDGVTKGQLNLNDMLDALHSSLPTDAFAALLITDHDLYEDEDDDFCAGRAYGGSGICITSTFRYHPALDNHASINHAHSWPTSHCRDYVDECWEQTEPGLKDTEYGQQKRTKKGREKIDATCMLSTKQSAATPLAAAVLAARQVMTPTSKEEWTGLWLARVCRTASHELGHCVGIGHCTHFACVMQGTAGVAEDMRQPPYLCPICLKKVAYSLVGESVMKERGPGKLERSFHAEDRWVAEGYRQMKAYCDGKKEVGMFAGYAAWLDMRLGELGADDQVLGGNTEDSEGDDDDSLILVSSRERLREI
jgi:archaemetzincin